MKKILQICWQAIKKVFINKRYVMAAIVFAIFIYLLAVITHKYAFIGFVIKSELFNVAERLKLIFGSLLSIDTNFTSLFSFWSVIVVSIIASLDIVLLVYLLRRQANAYKESGASFFGVLAGMFGIGCAACGSVILTSIFGLSFTAGLISFLPLDGGEFMIIALIVMLISVYFVSKKIINPMVCKPKRASEIDK